MSEEQKEFLQLIHDYISQYIYYEEAMGDPETVKGWIAAIDRITKDLEGMILGINPIPNENLLRASSFERMLESFEKDKENVHICGEGENESMTVNSKPFECFNCGEHVEGVQERVKQKFQEKIRNYRKDA